MCQQIISVKLWRMATSQGWICMWWRHVLSHLFLSQNPSPQFPSREWDLSSCSTSTLGVVGSQYPGHFQERETPKLSQNAPCQQTFVKELRSDLGVSFLVHTSTLPCNTFCVLLRCFLNILTLSRVALPNWVTMSYRSKINLSASERIHLPSRCSGALGWGSEHHLRGYASHCSPRSSVQCG